MVPKDQNHIALPENPTSYIFYIFCKTVKIHNTGLRILSDWRTHNVGVVWCDAVVIIVAAVVGEWCGVVSLRCWWSGVVWCMGPSQRHAR